MNDQMPDAGRQMCEKWSSKEKGCVKLTPFKNISEQKQSKNAEKKPKEK